MAYEPIKRNRYSYGSRECSYTVSNFNQDFDEFHLPVSRLVLSNLHEWGIAQGLEVGGTIGSNIITINPGVAIDAQGRLISLSSDGSGAIGKISTQRSFVPFQLNTSDYQQPQDTTYYLTIEFNELELSNQRGRPCDRVLEQVPWIRLQPVSGDGTYVDDGTSVVLGQVVIDAQGKLKELKTDGRRLVGKTVEQLNFQRADKAADQVKQVSAAKIKPAASGGLQITVPNANDKVLLEKEGGGNFTKLEVHTDTLDVAGNIKASELQGTRLQLSTDGAIAGSLSIQNDLSVSRNADIRGNLKISGNLEVQGNVIARDTEHIAGNVSLGDADNDEVKITGVVRSGHSSGALRVDDALYVNGKLAIDGDNDLEFTQTAKSKIIWNSKVNLGSDKAFLLFKDNSTYVAKGTENVRLSIGVFNDFGNSETHADALDIQGGARLTLNAGAWDTELDTEIGTPAVGDYLKGISFCIKNAEKMLIDKNGNVGVGTTAPSEKLEVAGNVKITGARLKSANGWGIIETNQQDWLRINPDQTYPAIALHKPVAIGTGGLTIGEWTQLPQGQLKVTQSAYMATAGGNVGIGTTNPGAKLHVINASQDANGNTLILGSTDASNLRLGYHADYSWIQSHGSKPIAINPLGNNVGIGTTTPQGFQIVLPERNKTLSPTAGVTIAGGKDGNANIELRNNGTGTPYIDFSQSESGDYDARIRLTEKGKLSIEGAKLEVAGDIRAGNSDIYFTKTDHNHSAIGNTAGYAAIENAANYDALMILGRAGTSKGRYVRLWDYLQVNGGMDITGNVGIGTTNPGAALDVNGWIHISGGHGLRFYNSNQSQHWEIYPQWNDGGDPDLMFDFSGKTRDTGWVRGWLEPEGGWRQPSDKRLKQDIEPFSHVLERVMQLQPKSYHWINTGKSSIKLFGFIAQEVEEIFPDFVTEKSGIKAMKYNDFTVLAIAAIQEQQELFTQLKEEIANLKEQVQKLTLA